MSYSEYLVKIAKAKDISKVKELAKQIYDDQELLGVQKKALLSAYKERLRELHLQIVKTSDNKTFVSIYYLLKKRSDPEIGKLIYDLHQKNVLSKEEADILFRLYEKKSLDIPDESEQAQPDQPETQVEPF